MSRNRLRLVVLFGGQSAEHDVSCVTAVSVLQALDPDRYDVVPVGITPRGEWVLVEVPTELPPSLRPEGPPISPFDALAGGVVLPLLHGPLGEDGTVQGLCELAGVPYVGSGVLGSAVAMDKLTAKRLLEGAGLRSARWVGVRAHDIGPDLEERVATQLGWPVFVKPSNLGSSIGVSRAGDRSELQTAIDLALRYDEWLVIEEAVVGREIEVGVLGDLAPEASVPGEVRPSREFYDYEDKYEAGAAELLIPAPLPEEVAAEVRRLAVSAFGAVRAEGMARVDFFSTDGGQLLVNEVNTIPGFTPISMYPRLWEATGVPYPELLDRLVQFALDRHARRAGRVGAPR